MACGWQFLDNSHRVIRYNGKRILVTGVTYVYSRRINPGQLQSLIGSAPDADLKVLLVHQPSQMVIRAAREAGYHIMMAGHTHGGQIVFKPFGFTLTPTMFENSFYSGYYLLDKLHLFVTNGIGLTMMPVRFRAPAEIQQITLNTVK
jgi:predicted MPP superfamily phosphohydrolase